MLCPKCNTSYTDESLRFCLSDGAALVGSQDESATVVRKGTATVNSAGTGTWLKAIIGLVIVGFLGIAAAGLAGALYYYNSGGSKTAEVKPTVTPMPLPTPTTDAEKQRLQDELANLQKKLENQRNTPTTPNPPPDEHDEMVTARVNSPGDGFLALRDAPDAKNGARLAKIPHGAVIEIDDCEQTRVAVDGRTGRWCMVTYHGMGGWVFDAWLDY